MRRILTTQRGRRAALLLAALAVSAAAIWAVRAHPEALDRWTTFTKSPTAAILGALGLAAVLAVAVGVLLAIMGVRRRWAWIGAGALALASSAVALMGLRTYHSTPVRLSAFNPENWAPAEPAGPFKETATEAVLGWHWVHGGDRWREALIVQPPFRLSGHAALSAGRPLRLFLTLSRQVTGASNPAVRVRCTVSDRTGRAAAQYDGTLNTEGVCWKFGAWEELRLDPSGANTPDAEVVLEVVGDDPEVPGAHLPAVAIAAPPAALSKSPTTPGPNCVFILVDAVRPDCLHCYGFPLETLPHIDRLAEQGALFEQAVSVSSWTVPSVASLFTGTYASTHGMVRFRIPGDLSLPTLAEQFREVGARTGAVSASLMVTPASGFGQGFEEFVGIDTNEFATGVEQAPRAAWVTDRAIRLLRRFNGQRFFLYLHYMDPHTEYDPPPGWATFGESARERYLGEIRYCDSEIGRLLDKLDALGRTGDTLVVFIADHGEAFMEHGFNKHGNSVHRQEVDVPLILRYPGHVPAGRRVRSRIPSIDVHATIAELMGLSVPRHVEGESLVPLFRKTGDINKRFMSPVFPDRRVLSELLYVTDKRLHPQVCLYEGDYKLILRLDGERRSLYQVRLDPGEKADLAANRAALAASMEGDIRRFLKMRKGVRETAGPPTAAEKARLKALGYVDPGGP